MGRASDGYWGSAIVSRFLMRWAKRAWIALPVAFTLMGTSPAAAQYFDIYGEGNRILTRAQAAYDAMPADAAAKERA